MVFDYLIIIIITIIIIGTYLIRVNPSTSGISIKSSHNLLQQWQVVFLEVVT